MDTQQRSGDEEAAGALDLRHYWNTIKKRRWIIMTTVLLVSAGQYVLTSRKVPLYQAAATVVVNPQAPKIMGQQGEDVVQLGSGGFWVSPDYYNTQNRIITSRNLAERIARQFPGWKTDPRLIPNPPPDATEEELVQLAANAIHGRISARVLRESRVIAITVKARDPRLAADLANDGAQAYIDQNVSVKQDVTRNANYWVAAQLDEASAKLKKSEDALVEFKVKNDILSVSLEDRQNQISRDLELYGISISEVQKLRTDLEARRRQLIKLLATDPEGFANTVVAGAGEKSTGTLSSALDAYVAARQKLGELQTRYGVKHPDVATQSQIVESALTDLRGSCDAVIRSLDVEIASLIERESKYAAKLEELRKGAFVLNGQTQQYKRLSRENEMAEQNYRMLASRLAESGLQVDDTANNIQWLDRAEVPGNPVAPNKRRDMAGGLMLGLALAIGLVFLIEYLDRSVKSQEDVEKVLGLPFLGMVPKVEGAMDMRDPKETPELYTFRNPNSTGAECCRVLRTNILFSSPDKPLRIFLVSSSNQSEGKTTTVINLGITMAQAGHRTLLIDADMRRPRLHSGLGVSNENGISRVIVGESEIDAAVKSTDVPNLYVLPCGPRPPNPAELLQTEKFTRLIATLGEKFDRVIIDSPPILAVTDAVIVSRAVDGLVLVVRASKTPHDSVMRAKRAILTVKSRIIGVVLNDVNLKNPAYYNYYNYYHHQYHEAPAGAGDSKRG